MKTRLIILGAIAVIVVTTSAVFATLLFTQTFPPITRTSGLIANCTTLNVAQSGGAVPPVGATGFILFDCSGTSGGASAFSVPTSAIATPTFALPAGYTELSYVQQGLICGVNSNVMTSGTLVNFPNPAEFDYCAKVDSSTLQLVTFDVTWNS